MSDISVLICERLTHRVLLELPLSEGEFDLDLFGGCGRGRFKVPLPFQDYELLMSLYLHAPMRVKILDNPIWQGYVVSLMPEITGDRELVDVICDGWVYWLKHIPYQWKFRKGEPAPLSGLTITRYSDIVRDLAVLIQGDARMAITGLDIEDSDELPDLDDVDFPAEFTVRMDTIYSPIETLARLAGNWMWGVDANRQFYFKPTIEAVAHHVQVGRDVMEFTPQRDTSKIENRLLVRGGQARNLAGEEYTVFGIFWDAASETDWGTHFSIRQEPAINCYDMAERYALKVFEEFSQPQDTVGLKLPPNYGLILPTDGRVHVFVEPTGHYYYRTLKTKCRITDAGLNAAPELGLHPPNLAATIERMRMDIGKLQKEAAEEEYYYYSGDWDVPIGASLICSLEVI